MELDQHMGALSPKIIVMHDGIGMEWASGLTTKYTLVLNTLERMIL